MFILASSSPQRKQLLEGLGIDFTVEPSTIDESLCEEVDPAKRAQVLSRLKAEDVALRHPDAWVLGSDTLVVSHDGQLLEKPVDAADAERMLRLHSGNTSVVHSGICLVGPASRCHPEPDEGLSDSRAIYEDLSSSYVTFAELSDEQIAWWISTGEWENRSGSFQIDGKGQMMICNVNGDWTGVVGLPVFVLGGMLREVELL